MAYVTKEDQKCFKSELGCFAGLSAVLSAVLTNNTILEVNHGVLNSFDSQRLIFESLTHEE